MYIFFLILSSWKQISLNKYQEMIDEYLSTPRQIPLNPSMNSTRPRDEFVESTRRIRRVHSTNSSRPVDELVESTQQIQLAFDEFIECTPRFHFDNFSSSFDGNSRSPHESTLRVRRVYWTNSSKSHESSRRTLTSLVDELVEPTRQIRLNHFEFP